MSFILTISPEVKASALGAGLSGFSVIIGMPFDNVKTILQADPGATYRTILTKMYREGTGAFYKGTLPFLVQRIIKTGSRTPVMIISDKVTESMADSPFKKTVVNSFITTLFDTVVINPTELVKVRKMTEQKQVSLFKMVAGIAPREFTRGFWWTFAKTYLAWMNFFLMRDLSLAVNKQITGETRLSPIALVASGVATTATKLVFTTPADVIKTQLQKTEQNQHTVNSRAIIRHIVTEYGWTKLFRGLGPRAVHGFMATVIGNYVLDYYQAQKKHQ